MVPGNAGLCQLRIDAIRTCVNKDATTVGAFVAGGLPGPVLRKSWLSGWSTRQKRSASMHAVHPHRPAIRCVLLRMGLQAGYCEFQAHQPCAGRHFGLGLGLGGGACRAFGPREQVNELVAAPGRRPAPAPMQLAGARAAGPRTAAMQPHTPAAPAALAGAMAKNGKAWGHWPCAGAPVSCGRAAGRSARSGPPASRTGWTARPCLPCGRCVLCAFSRAPRPRP